VKITIIQGHPDPQGKHYCHALADAYAAGAERAGHSVERIEVARIDFRLIRSQQDFESESAPADIEAAQRALRWADHLVFVYPLWLGSMPALLKGFLEQTFRPGFAFTPGENGTVWSKGLLGRSARVVITMGMPAFMYRWYFGAHSLKSLERSTLRFCGIRPVRETLVGMAASGTADQRRRVLEKVSRYGASGR
jgi:putative NADPH-quinone reductase